MRNADEIAQIIYNACFHRAPVANEVNLIRDRLAKGEPVIDIIEALSKSGESKRYQERLFMPPGHFYSPIVDVDSLKQKFPAKRQTAPPALPDVDIDIDAMTKLWDEKLAPVMGTAPLPEQPDGQHRYHFRNPAYSYGDALVLRAMILANRPKRIVEVGSGWSSACTLDTVFDEAKLDTEITFIEPYPKVLRSIMREGDESRVNIIELIVQDVPLSFFDQLEANDILLINSTHVVKTGSDVVHELTQILPRLKPGVLIHFHDIFYPFEYGHKWVIEENRSWNEIYALRSFLAFNDNFKVIFFNDMFLRLRQERLEKDCPAFLKNSGGAIWIRRVEKNKSSWFKSALKPRLTGLAQFKPSHRGRGPNGK